MIGSCHCGGVGYEVGGAVHRFGHCHCDDCRKLSGAAFNSVLVVDAAGFRVTRGESLLVRYESSPGKSRYFCGTCGSPIYARMESRPHIVIIRAGTLDTPPAHQPQMHIWVKAKVPWYDIMDDLPQFQEGYVQK